jgi:CheY-like chemotaxis protein
MSTMKVMIVDDEPAIGRLLSYQLHGFGYDVCYVQDGLQALECVLIERPDLILLDVVMPLVSGWDVCREIRGSSSVPIIMLTGKNADADIITGLGAGADDYVTKPFSIAQLQARIEAVMRRTGTLKAEGRTLKAASIAPRPAEQPWHEQPVRRSNAPETAAPPVVRAKPSETAQLLNGSDAKPTPIVPQRLGTRMREARQRRGITLYQAERDTRVRWEFLQAIEQENWTYLPRHQLRPAIQAYTGFLGLDAREFDAGLPRTPPNLHAPLAALTLVVMLLLVVGLTFL